MLNIVIRTLDLLHSLIVKKYLDFVAVVEEQPTGQGPRVITKPVPLVLEEGQTAKFECELSAVPVPEVGVQ